MQLVFFNWWITHTIRCGLSDSAISLLDFSTSAAQHIIIASTTQTWMLYSSIAVAFLDSSSYCVLRSIATKMSEGDEAGRILSVIAVTGSLMPLVAGPAFGTIYKSTLSLMPETICYVMGGMYAVLVVTMAFIHCGLKDVSSTKKEAGRAPTIKVEVTENPGCTTSETAV